VYEVLSRARSLGRLPNGRNLEFFCHIFATRRVYEKWGVRVIAEKKRFRVGAWGIRSSVISKTIGRESARYHFEPVVG